jgi:DNA-binding response OmpR family regulator
VDLALIDLGLADGDGLDLLAELHKSDGKAIPVIVFSGQDPGIDVAERVDAVLTKSPTSLDRLLGIVRLMASQRRGSRAADVGEASADGTPSKEVA